ncbi:MAG: DUF3306 domain-containing protein [Rhodospirillaceae bacterium]
MSTDEQDKTFLSRWSRLKAEARKAEAGYADDAPADGLQVPAAHAGAPDLRAPSAEAPAVPPVESLDIDSDYRPFFHPKIEEGVRRAALKKLFSDPHFNVMDGLDVYIDDYSKADPLPDGMLGELEQARKILGWSREDAEERAKAEKQRLAQSAAAPAAVPATPEPQPEAQPTAASINPAPHVE